MLVKQSIHLQSQIRLFEHKWAYTIDISHVLLNHHLNLNMIHLLGTKQDQSDIKEIVQKSTSLLTSEICMSSKLENCLDHTCESSHILPPLFSGHIFSCNLKRPRQCLLTPEPHSVLGCLFGKCLADK